jgi:hypothetical protein
MQACPCASRELHAAVDAAGQRMKGSVLADCSRATSCRASREQLAAHEHAASHARSHLPRTTLSAAPRGSSPARSTHRLPSQAAREALVAAHHHVVPVVDGVALRLWGGNRAHAAGQCQHAVGRWRAAREWPGSPACSPLRHACGRRRERDGLQQTQLRLSGLRPACSSSPAALPRQPLVHRALLAQLAPPSARQPTLPSATAAAARAAHAPCRRWSCAWRG